MTPRWLTAVASTIAPLVAIASLSSCTSTPPAQPAASPTPSPTTESGFKVETDGFSFANYGNDDGIANLEGGTLQALFGDQVCARRQGDSCALYPSAKAWMRAVNDSMDGGHCFGMAGLSWAMFAGLVDPQPFGAPDAAELKLAGNAALQQELAQLFATQYTKPTSTSNLEVTPVKAMTELERAWGLGTGYVLAMYRMEDGEQVDGHAVTPVMVRDLDGDEAEILIYDNNFPGKLMSIEVDTARDRWEYTTTSDPRDDPEPYEGGARNRLELYPIESMLETQQCPFCSDEADAEEDPVGSGQPPVPQYNMVFLNQEAGHGGVAIDVFGDNGRPVPGQMSHSPLTAGGGPSDPDVAFVPKDEAFVVEVDATDLRRPADTDVTIIGPGYDFGVGDIDMEPGHLDEIRFDPPANRLRYRSDAGATPDIVLGLDNPDASYEFLIGGLRLRRDGEVDVRLDPVAQTVTASTGNTGRAVLDFQVDRITQTGDERYTSEPIPLAAGESIVLEYGRWNGEGEPMPAGIDQDGDGVIDERLIPPDTE